MSDIYKRIARRYLSARPDLPEVVYHATPYPDSIMQGGFELRGDRQTFGGHEGEYISTTHLEAAENYAQGLRVAAAFLGGHLDWDGMKRRLEKVYGVSNWNRALAQNSRINDLRRSDAPTHEYLQQGLDVDGNPISKQDELDRRWGLIKHLWVVADDFPLFSGVQGIPMHLTKLDPSQIGIVEAKVRTDEATPGERHLGDDDPDWNVTYNSSEDEWRFWNPDLLVPVNVIRRF